ncbi:MAG: polysaccharide biosynthesis tyrosine autokinase [Bacteroidales bacterium]|nr:polysaccharide biosynthesis tyrosine autokinase [Bacteroidales bacterium]
MTAPMTKKRTSDIVDIHYLASLFQKHYLAIGICIFVGLAISFFLNKTKHKVFEVKAQILISSEENTTSTISAQFMEGFGMFGGENNFQNEIQKLRSSVLIRRALNELNFYVSYYSHSRLSKEELYKNTPFVIVFDRTIAQPINLEINLEVIDKTGFKIRTKGEDVPLYNFSNDNIIQTVSELKIDKNARFGQTIHNEYLNFKLILNENVNIDDYPTKKFSFIIRDPKSLSRYYQSAMEIAPVDLESSVAELSIKSTVPQKDIDFINTLLDTYLERELEKKRYMSLKTIEYIDDQLNVIKDSLKIAEENLQRFRSNQGIMDVTVQSGRVYEQLRELEREKASVTVNYKYYQYINDYFELNKEFSDLIAPSAMGIEDPLLNNMIQELLQLNAERAGLIQNNQEKSPYLSKLNIQIENLKNTITENIKYILNTTEISLQDVNGRISELNREIRKLPETERELFGIERKFNLNDAIYTYLLEKRSEAQIAIASFLPDAEIVEPADVVGSGPISPKTRLNYFMGLLLGLILPLVFFRFKDTLSVRLKDVSEIEKFTSTPILAKIYKNNKKIELVVNNFPKSHIAESFRMLRTNLRYFLPKSKNSIISITSNFAQEGKSFLANNLSVALANANNSTILLGFDMRKPKVFERLNIKNEIGISSFLSEQANFEEVVQKTNIPNLDVITSGPIPPNPSELTASTRMNDLFSFLTEKYDYIIIDTPPVGLVSDTYLLLDQADLNIFVVRLNHSIKKESFAVLSELQDKKIKNLCLVVNELPLLRSSKYGYGYYDDRKGQN